METEVFFKISGQENGERIESRILEERIQNAVDEGYRNIEVEAFGQHGIGGRLFKAGKEPVNIKITGASGQRTGSLGCENTSIDIKGPASDDIGWLNAGAEIIVRGNAGNGSCNAMAQGKVYVAGNIGARGMTMTKSNPRFAPPELWVLGSVGDYFGEFMAGGFAVICGVESQSNENVLGYRPLVGMVGGSVFVRGDHKGFSEGDAKEVEISDADWEWLCTNLKIYLAKIDREELLEKLSVRGDWQLISAKNPQEKIAASRMSMSDFRRNVWDKELGKGGLIGDLSDLDMSPLPVITTGEYRRYVPVWENRMYYAPCHATCPSGIPVEQRWGLVREGKIDEAIELALEYTPFPATVCGYLCPNPCMTSCTRNSAAMPPVDIRILGKESINANTPAIPEKNGKKIAIVGGGPAGISTAWQLTLKGYSATIYDRAERLGGKIAAVIPESRIPSEVLSAELNRIREVIPHETLEKDLTPADIEKLKSDNEYVIIATGAQKPRMLNVPGKEKMITGNEFLAQAKAGTAKPGKKVVIIGAGNSACDAATECSRAGAEDITLIDVQKPASFGDEREAAEACGAVFRWPCFTEEITDEGVKLTSGEVLPADTVIISIGDVADTDFLPESVEVRNGYVVTDDQSRTTDPAIFAIGDITGLGLITSAIGQGRKVAERIIFQENLPEEKTVIDKNRVSLEYFSPSAIVFSGAKKCGDECASCGNCRDCGICVAICPKSAISRVEAQGDVPFEYVVDSEKCIGCGFCAGACPCGIWNIVPNTPIG